jgi:crotonobetainyl-CoA:carnitine CoA-transferase CaiB-like acyl-CoA transferase
MQAAQGGDRDPVFLTIPVNDVTAGALSTLGVCLALFHRARTLQGQRIWTSLAGCSVLLQGDELVSFSGRQVAVTGGRDFRGPSTLDRFYQTRDGWIRLQARDVAALSPAGFMPDPAPDGEDALRHALAAWFVSQSTADMLERLTAAGVPAAPARHLAELAHDSTWTELGAFQRFEREDGRVYNAVGRYAVFSRTQESHVLQAPGIGEHSREVLAEAGLAAEAIERLLADGIVLQGTPMLAAPLAPYR